jgi:hypothetical protein
MENTRGREGRDRVIFFFSSYPAAVAAIALARAGTAGRSAARTLGATDARCHACLLACLPFLFFCVLDRTKIRFAQGCKFSFSFLWLSLALLNNELEEKRISYGRGFQVVLNGGLNTKQISLTDSTTSPGVVGWSAIGAFPASLGRSFPDRPGG